MRARLALCLELSRELIGFPRHLSQHPGGFLIARGRLDELVPIENASMEDRTVVSWYKDDIEALGMLKVDVLALGMLTCLAKGFELLRKHYGRSLTPATVPAEDATYEMLSRADSIGVFQVESRAQQTMLPGLSRARSTISSSRLPSSGPAPYKAIWCIPICAAAKNWKRSLIQAKS
jgi:error-prone DNA polymerase